MIDWIIFSILSSKDYAECLGRLKYFIDAATHSINIQGYSFVFACCIALSSKYISRLQKILSSLGVSYADKLNKIKRFGQVSHYDRVLEENKDNHPYLPIFDYWMQSSFTELISFNSDETVHFAVLEGIFRKLQSYQENISKLRNQTRIGKNIELLLQAVSRK